MSVSMINSLMPPDELIPTRASLLERLKDPGDQASWNRFYDIYHDLIFSVARRAGLNAAAANEVVQDTLISVAKKMPEFTYDPAKDSFKGWLLTVARWRIRDQFGKRLTQPDKEARPHTQDERQDTRTGTIDRVPDPSGSDLAKIWEE